MAKISGDENKNPELKNSATLPATNSLFNKDVGEHDFDPANLKLGPFEELKVESGNGFGALALLTYEEAIELAGGFGCYQKVLLLLSMFLTAGPGT